MSKKLVLLLPLLAGVPVFLTGALRRPPVEAAPAFVAQPGPSAPPAAAVFDRALERLAPAQLAWLRVTLWQRMHAAEVAYESEGTLQLGPNDCARLELTVHTGAAAGHWLVVSDGHALAHVVQLGKAAPTVTSRLLVPTEPDPETPVPKSPAETLRELGCGGPYPLLQDLRTRLRDLTAEAGVYRGRSFVRLKGRPGPAQAAPATGTAVAADFCYLYLDAQSLWPGRLEWWATAATPNPRLLLEMEFRDPRLNHPLSVPECIRAFSYRPDGST